MVNRAKVEEAIRLLLEGIGEDVNREGLKDTPARVARMYEEICGGMGQSPKEHLEKTFAVFVRYIQLKLIYLFDLNH